MNMNLFCGCITHRFADVNKLGAYSSLQYKHDNAVVLKTCNRFEVYFSNKEYMNKLKEYYGNDMKFFSGKDCIRHLIEVCCGLDSMVVGENQILGQVKNAYTSANKASPNKKLSILFQRAIHIGKKVRAETKISSGNVSLATVAVEFAERIFGSLKGKNVLILGAGKMAKLLAKNIVNKKINPIIFANRTYEDAKYLAKQLNGKAIKFSELGKYLPKADLVLCATSAPHPIITRDNIEKFLRKKIVIIDISNPRNVDESVCLLKNVKLYTLDSM
ncbi:MAG: glutamyl-tRNA reductase, partial [Candidatus Thermoplasmatota archaeon]